MNIAEFITNELNGSNIELVLQKRLFASDLKHSQNRLSMPAKQLVRDDFLTADERRVLNDKRSSIKVRMLGPNLRMYNEMLELKIWSVGCVKVYVLARNWNDFVKQHHEFLKEGRLIQVWSFRINEQLCFAVICPDN